MIWVVIIATLIFGPMGFVGAVAFWIWLSVSNSKQNRIGREEAYSTDQPPIVQLTPCIHILSHYALKYQAHWTPEKVRTIKAVFDPICHSQAEQLYLREQLKQSSSLPIERLIQQWLQYNPSVNDKEVIFSNVAVLLAQTCSDSARARADALFFGTRIGLSQYGCQRFLQQIFGHYDHSQQSYTQPKQHNERQSAADILGVSVHASQEEIQRAYRLKIKEFHPDRNANATPAVRALLEQEAMRINEARDILLAKS